MPFPTSFQFSSELRHHCPLVKTNKRKSQPERVGPSQHCPELLVQQQAHLERNGPGRRGLDTYAFNGKDKQFLPFR